MTITEIYAQQSDAAMLDAIADWAATTGAAHIRARRAAFADLVADNAAKRQRRIQFAAYCATQRAMKMEEAA